MTPLIPIVLTLFLIFFTVVAGFAAMILYTVVRTVLPWRRPPWSARPIRPARRTSQEEQRLVEMQAIAALNQPE